MITSPNLPVTSLLMQPRQLLAISAVKVQWWLAFNCPQNLKVFFYQVSAQLCVPACSDAHGYFSPGKLLFFPFCWAQWNSYLPISPVVWQHTTNWSTNQISLDCFRSTEIHILNYVCYVKYKVILSLQSVLIFPIGKVLSLSHWWIFFLNQAAITQLDVYISIYQEWKKCTNCSRNVYHLVGSNPYTTYDRCYLAKFSVMKKASCSPSSARFWPPRCTWVCRGIVDLWLGTSAFRSLPQISVVARIAQWTQVASVQLNYWRGKKIKCFPLT